MKEPAPSPQEATPDLASLKSQLVQQALSLEFDDCRITSAAPPEHGDRFLAAANAGYFGAMAWLARGAEKRLNPNLILPQAQSFITLAASYFQPEFESPDSPPLTPIAETARYACHSDYHHAIGDRLQSLVDWLNRVAPTPSRSLWYVDTGPILEREMAARAGLGFVGKHTNLIHRKLGNWTFIGVILTTLSLPPDPPQPNRCGHCTRCLDACPTNAFPAPFTLDARRCISYLTIELRDSIPVPLRKLIGNRLFGCDDCLAVCPWNRFAQAGRLMRPYARPHLRRLNPIQLLQLTEPEFRSLFRDTPLWRTKLRGLKRNAAVVLGNLRNPAALPALEQTVATCGDPMVAEHAAWAIAEIVQHPVATTAPHPPPSP